MNRVRLLVMMLVLTLGGMGAWVWKAKNNEWEAREAATEAEQKTRDALAAKDAELQRSLQEQQARHERDIAALNDKHEQDLDALRKTEHQRMAQAFTQFSDILDG